MKTRTRRKKNRWLGGLRILIYMNTEKQKRKVRWFSITRIGVLVWNIITLIYHIIIIGMTTSTGISQHIVGMIIEYFMAGIYENSVVRMDKIINRKTLTCKHQKTKRILIKYVAFGIIFSVTYTIVYILRMLIIHFIGWGFLDGEQTERAIINGIVFGCIVGPIIGMLVVWARNKGLRVKITKKNNIPMV